MIEDGNNEKLDEQFSLLDARARKRRRSSVVTTIVLSAVTGALILQFAGDIVKKQAQVQKAEASKGELDKQLKSEQEKLDTAIRAREKLEDEIKDLEATKKSYQKRILSDKDAHNLGGASSGMDSAFVPPPASSGKEPGEQEDAPKTETAESASMLIEEFGKAPEGFYIKPEVIVVPGLGSSGRDIYKVQLSVELPEAQLGQVERVTYHLSPKYYLKNLIEGGSAPRFDAKFNVFACESTVLARVRLRDGTSLAFDFDWCRTKGWPPRKKEPVIVMPEDEKTPANSSSTKVPQQHVPGITNVPLPANDGRRP